MLAKIAICLWIINIAGFYIIRAMLANMKIEDRAIYKVTGRYPFWMEIIGCIYTLNFIASIVLAILAVILWK